MRILMIAPEPFLEPRGTPFSVYHRIKALTALGYEVDLVTYPLGKNISLPGLRVYRTPMLPFIHRVRIGPSLAKIPLDMMLFAVATWQLCQHRYRYIHTHEEAGVIGALLSMVFGCQHLYDMHSDLAQQMSNFSFSGNPWLIQAVKIVQRWIIRRSCVVIAICRDLQQAAQQYAPDKPVFLIENMAVDEHLPPVSEQEVTLLRETLRIEDGPVLLYTGTLELYQGIDLLLRSAVEVLKDFPQARYVIVGGQPDQVQGYQLLAQQLGIAEAVCFVGQRPLEEMPLYMALADLLLSPRSEGTNTPLKLYTYLRSGKPILATRIYSHTQILTDDTAMLVDPAPCELAQGTLSLLRDPELAQRLGSCAKQVAEEYYSWAAYLEKNRQAYEKLIASR